MTIVEAIKLVLQDSTTGLTAKEIYEEITKKELYSFGAKNPLGVVNSQIRRRCFGLDFPTSYPLKFFQIVGHRGTKNIFALYNENQPISEATNVQATRAKPTAEELPEERIDSALKEHITFIKQQVMDCILTNSPDFFERLVLDLLLKMGYGYGKQAGIVTGRPHDGGIDGIISEDKLGLGLIYIQAKRYSPSNKVGRSELQAFIGAMQHVQKGVFITTSNFTKDAVAYIDKQQQKNVRLIEGEFLTDLLVKYEIGVIPAQTISIYKIDADYYGVSG